MTATELATSKANSYIHTENIKKAKDEFVIENGIRFGSIRGPFDTKEYYLYY